MFLHVFLKKFRRRAIHNFVNTFGEKSVHDEATTAAKLSKIDVLNKNFLKNTISPKKADIGFACKIILQEAKAKKFASPLQVLEFQNDCVVLLQ